MNKYKNRLGIGILIGVLTLGSSTALANKTNLETKVVQVQEEQKERIKKQKESAPYKVLDEIIISDFLESYLKRITPQSNNFQKLRKKHGEKGLLDKYSSAHQLCLDLALKYENKIPNKEYVELGKQLSKKQHETSKGLSKINYLNKKVVKAFQGWGELKTQNFQKLLKASKKLEIDWVKLKTKKQKQDYIKKLHNLAYTKEEYVKYVKEQNKTNDNLYAKMKGTLNFIESLIGGGELERIRKMTALVYTEPLKKYFKNEKKD